MSENELVTELQAVLADYEQSPDGAAGLIGRINAWLSLATGQATPDDAYELAPVVGGQP